MAPLNRPLNILLVEDDPGDAELVKLSIAQSREPHSVIHATTLARAMAANRQVEQFDAILLDLSLPDSFGFSTVAAVRQAYPASPIVVLTGLDDPEVEFRIVESGAQDYLLKSNVDSHGLDRAIHHAIIRQKLEQRLVESEAAQRAVINLAPDAILTVAPDLSIASANPAAAKIFGFPHEAEMLKLPATAILPEIETMLAACAEQAEVRKDSIGIRGTETFPAATAIALLGNGRFLVMAVDISERVRLTNELKELARTDPLTGLANRRAFVEAIEAEFRRFNRSGATAGVLMVDIDHFKQVNDLRGHDAGDQALAALAGVLQSSVRNTDFPARFGGEEFVILLTEVDGDRALEMAERIRRSVEPLANTSQSGDFHVTVSIGLTLFRGDDPDWSAAVKRADEAMYQAKAGGRNRVVLIH
jgi:diguanylate cyclase (GGDEF)-like protein